MFAINQFCTWIDSCFTTNVHDQPDYWDPEIAFDNAGWIVHKLGFLQGWVERECSHRKDALELLHRVRKELEGENWGTLPDDLLEIWCDTYTYRTASDEQKQAMSRVCKRWGDTNRINEEFHELHMYEIFWKELPNMPVEVEECLDEFVNWAKEWLAGKHTTTKVD